ncbi:helix-turn-helix domain-containing protein [Deinococcus yunweiensis]|uniref:helix-turn-helix domain-containing protein n=1 Tax=Deinococcus yunweiensis TaxID=367282 RepID=UPI00398EB1CF
MFYSVQEVAEILKLSETTVLRLIHDGELRAVKLGQRLYRIHDSTIRSLVDSGLVPVGVK